MAKGTKMTDLGIEKRKNKGIAKANREQRQTEAITRQEKHDKLTVKQKFEKLDKRLGVGIGADKERARLLKKLIKED